MHWIYIICGVLLVLTGGARIYFAQTGRIPPATAIATYLPWFYLVVGAIALIYGISEL